MKFRRLLMCMTIACLVASNVEVISHGKEKNESQDSSCLSEVIEGAEELEPITEKDEWFDDENNLEYPINITDSEWKDLEDHQEMLEACTMPEEVYKNATTEELLDMVLTYPLLCDIYTYDTIQEGLIALCRNFNGLQELLKRSDMSSVILERYKGCEVQLTGKATVEGFYETTELVILEALLAQDEIIAQLEKEEKEELLDAVEEKVEEKQDSSLYDSEESVFYDLVLDNGLEDSLDICIENIKSIDEDGSVYAASSTTYVKTPKGSKVQVIKQDDFSQTRKDQLNKDFKQAYPKATFISTATKKYNCHSYAWYKQSTSNKYWMNSPKKYVSDGSYKYVGKKGTAVGQKVVYKYQKGVVDNWIHSGVVSKAPFTITSKWGQGPLMKHALLVCPYNTQSNAFHFYRKK